MIYNISSNLIICTLGPVAIRTRATVSKACHDSAPILGSFGSFAPPRIAGLRARDERSNFPV